MLREGDRGVKKAAGVPALGKSDKRMTSRSRSGEKTAGTVPALKAELNVKAIENSARKHPTRPRVDAVLER
jgi:hypothetical protein